MAYLHFGNNGSRLNRSQSKINYQKSEKRTTVNSQFHVTLVTGDHSTVQRPLYNLHPFSSLSPSIFHTTNRSHTLCKKREWDPNFSWYLHFSANTEIAIMELFFYAVFGGLAAVVAVLELSKNNKDRINTSSVFNSFKNNYLLIYSLMMGRSGISLLDLLNFILDLFFYSLICASLFINWSGFNVLVNRES